MAETIAKSYLDVPASYHEGTVTLCYRWDGGSNPLAADGDTLKFFKLPRFAKLLNGLIEIEALDSHATPTNTIAIKVTDGTTTYTLDSAIAGGTAGVTRFDGTGWIGKVLDTGAQWYAYVECTDVSATATASPYVVLELAYTMDLQADEN